MGKIDKILTGLFVAAAIVLLVGHRFNASWAGGTGYLPQGVALPLTKGESEGVSSQQPLIRGQSASTTDAFSTYSINNSHVFLDHNTTVTLLDGRTGHTSWRVDTGRVVVEGVADLHVRNLTVHIDGQATLVHYSWLDRVDVLLLNGSGSDNDEALVLDQPVSISTGVSTEQKMGLKPISTSFSLVAPSVKPFYDWALSTAPATKAQ